MPDVTVPSQDLAAASAVLPQHLPSSHRFGFPHVVYPTVVLAHRMDLLLRILRSHTVISAGPSEQDNSVPSKLAIGHASVCFGQQKSQNMLVTPPINNTL